MEYGCHQWTGILAFPLVLLCSFQVMIWSSFKLATGYLPSCQAFPASLSVLPFTANVISHKNTEFLEKSLTSSSPIDLSCVFTCRTREEVINDVAQELGLTFEQVQSTYLKMVTVLLTPTISGAC